MTGLALGKAFNMPVEAISAFDPYFHYAAFHSISGVLNEEAGKVFRFKEQEKLHEEIIDSGLAKIYQSHLDISREIAQAEQTDVKTTLLDGKAFEKIIQYVRKDVPALADRRTDRRAQRRGHGHRQQHRESLCGRALQCAGFEPQVCAADRHAG